jgi:hypothetical protein
MRGTIGSFLRLSIGAKERIRNLKQKKNPYYFRSIIEKIKYAVFPLFPGFFRHPTWLFTRFFFVLLWLIEALRPFGNSQYVIIPIFFISSQYFLLFFLGAFWGFLKKLNAGVYGALRAIPLMLRQCLFFLKGGSSQDDLRQFGFFGGPREKF